MPAISGTQRFVTQARAGVARFGATRFGAYRPVIRVTISGQVVAIDKSTLALNLTEDDRPGSCHFEVPIRDAVSAGVAVGAEVRVMQGDTHSTSAVLFHGRVRSVRHQPTRAGERGAVVVECLDARIDLGRRLVSGRFSSTDARSIVSTLITSFAPSTPAWSLDAVADVGVVDEIQFKDESLLGAIHRVAVATGARWYLSGHPSTSSAMIHLFEGAEATRYRGGAAHPLTDTTTHFWDLEIERDVSQTRTRVYVEGRSLPASADVPSGARAIPLTWAPASFFTSSLTRLRVNAQVLDSLAVNVALDVQPVVTNSLTASAATSAQTLTLGTALSSGLGVLTTPGWLSVGGQSLYFTNYAAPPFGVHAWGLPTSGPGSITSTIAAGEGVTVWPSITFATALEHPVSTGDTLHTWVQRDSAAARSIVAALDGSDGLIESVLVDHRLTAESCITRGDAELALFGNIEYRGSYSTRDPNANPGQEIAINVSSPVNVSSVTVRIVDVAISDPEDSSRGYTFPVRRVSFTSQRYRDIFQLIQREPTRT
jgi:hypothetical protein